MGNITLEKRKVKEDTIELVANQIYNKITKLKRLGINGGAYVVEPIIMIVSIKKTMVI